MKVFSILAAILFLLCSVLNLIGQFMGTRQLSRMTKPYLMPTLLVFTLSWLLISSAPSWTILLYVVALLFHTGGDILLLFPTMKFFLRGLISFLVGHIFYIAIFSDGLGNMNWIYFALSYGILLSLACFLFVKVKKHGVIMAFAVALYALLLGTVFVSCLSCAISRFSIYTFLLPVGSSLFILSDSMIAYARFKCRFKNHNFYVMLTYILAQALISVGIIGMQF